MNMNAHVLGIDPGSKSGATLLGPGRNLIFSAQLEAGDAGERTEIVAEAVARAVAAGTDLIIAREKWQAGGPHMTPRIAAGLGAAWGLWREQLYLHASILPDSRIHAVYPGTWRSAVLGAGAKSSGGWEALARAYVASRFGLKDPGDDETVSVCVACWAFTDAKVRKTVQDRPRWLGDYRVANAALDGDTIRDLESKLGAANSRVAELERLVAQHALDRSLQDTITTGLEDT